MSQEGINPIEDGTRPRFITRPRHMISSTEEDDFEIETSDEEVRGYEPSSEDIIKLFEQIAKREVIELDWKCPGRRPPTPADEFDSNNEDDQSAENMQEEKSDFDFQDEMSSLKLPVRPAGADIGPRGSAKKKTTSLDAILSNMARHRKLDMMEQDDDNELL